MSKKSQRGSINGHPHPSFRHEGTNWATFLIVVRDNNVPIQGKLAPKEPCKGTLMAYLVQQIAPMWEGKCIVSESSWSYSCRKDQPVLERIAVFVDVDEMCDFSLWHCKTLFVSSHENLQLKQ